jgi:hypothetical protein
MKRTIVLVALLLAASGCATTTQAPNNTPAQSANANAAATPQAAPTASETDVIAREKQIWDMIKKKDFDGFGNMLADDAIEVASDGLYDKAGIIKSVRDLELTDISMSDWKVVTLDKDAAVVTYVVAVTGTSGGQQIPPNRVRASTAWVNRGGKWLAVYHQGTEAKEAQASQPTPTSSQPSPKASPSTDSKPAASPSEFDAVAREKEVWEALKKRDYNGFASFLAEDQMEVGADRVNDKAGSVKGVSGSDMSSASLSDFKVVKLDDDASLVTYVVKMAGAGSGPEEERHSTIWVNRGGKWLAVFHQDTPVQKPPTR